MQPGGTRPSTQNPTENREEQKKWAFAATALVLFFPLSLICDWSIIALVFTIVYYELDKHDKEKLSLILIPGAYFILRTILYEETQTEYVTGTLSRNCKKTPSSAGWR